MKKKKHVAFRLLHRIYTEDKPERRDLIIKALKEQGFGFTIASGDGQAPNPDGTYGPLERSTIIDVVTENNEEQKRKIDDLVEEIRKKNDDQDAVLVARAKVSAKLVEKIKNAQEEEQLRRQTMVLDKDWTVELEPTRKRVVLLDGRIVLSIGNWHNLLGPAHQVRGIRVVEKSSGKFLKFEVAVPERRSPSRKRLALQNQPTET